MPNLFRAVVMCSVALLAGSGSFAHAAAEKKKKSVPPEVTANAELASPENGKAPRPKGSQSIAVLVNDEPITAYEIAQRAAFLALQSGGGGADFRAKAEARWKSIVKDPKTNERFKELLQKNKVTTQEEAQELQKKFVKQLQAGMVDQLKKEMRSSAMAGSESKAREELIEEKIKIQEAKRLNVVATDKEVDRIISGIAERNKMTIDQFGQHMKGMGVDIATMRNRFKAEFSWRDVIRRKFGNLVSVTDREVDQFVANTSASQDRVELQVQRITLPFPAAVDQGVIVQRLAEANALATHYSGCATLAGLAAQSAGAKYEDLGSRKATLIPEPTRSLLLSAADGDLLPASVAEGGIELWAVCGRKAANGETDARESASNQLRQKEFEVLAQKHLKDLRQDASIEIR
jgi:peptidyl-prolyl cis-trans isomerase SurA